MKITRWVGWPEWFRIGERVRLRDGRVRVVIAYPLPAPSELYVSTSMVDESAPREVVNAGDVVARLGDGRPS